MGEDALAALSRAHVAVFGLGGVGGHCAEALCRAGVGRLTLVDADKVTPSNLNRQLCALRSTMGQYKADVMRLRLLDINPACHIDARAAFFDASTADGFDFSAFDYVMDCIDTIACKLLLIERSRAAGAPLLCCLGTGNRLDASRFRFADIADTRACPLARVMRKELKARGITGVRVLYSDEPPATPCAQTTPEGRHPPASVSFVPPVAGLLLAGEAVRALIARAETV